MNDIPSLDQGRGDSILRKSSITVVPGYFIPSVKDANDILQSLDQGQGRGDSIGGRKSSISVVPGYVIPGVKDARLPIIKSNSMSSKDRNQSLSKKSTIDYSSIGPGSSKGSRRNNVPTGNSTSQTRGRAHSFKAQTTSNNVVEINMNLLVKIKPRSVIAVLPTLPFTRVSVNR